MSKENRKSATDLTNQDLGNDTKKNQDIGWDGTKIGQEEPDSLTCDIIQDLLPLYHDGAASEKTCQKVEHHLKNCELCQKEYGILCAEFSVEDMSESTKEEFDKVIKKQKRKQYMITTSIILLICSLFVLLFYVADRVPIIPVKSDEIRLEEVSRYWTKEGYRFAIPYDSMYNDSYPAVKVVSDGEEISLELTFKRTLFAYEHESYSWQHQVWASDYDLSVYGGDGITPEEIDYVKWDGEIIWSEAENGDDMIPIAYTGEDRYREEGEINIKGKNSISIEYFNSSVFAFIFGALAWGMPVFALIFIKKKRENIMVPVMGSFGACTISVIFFLGEIYLEVLEGDFSGVIDITKPSLILSIILLLGTSGLNVWGYLLHERRK